MRDTFLSFTYFSKNSQLNEIFDKEFNTLHFDFTPRGKKFEKTLPWLILSDGGEKIFAYRVKNIYANPNVCIRLSAPRSIEQSSDHRSKKEEEKKWISPRDKRERIISLLERVLTRRSVEDLKTRDFDSEMNHELACNWVEEGREEEQDRRGKVEINQISPEVAHGTVRRGCVELHNRAKLLSTGNVRALYSLRAIFTFLFLSFLGWIIFASSFDDVIERTEFLEQV